MNMTTKAQKLFADRERDDMAAQAEMAAGDHARAVVAGGARCVDEVVAQGVGSG